MMLVQQFAFKSTHKYIETFLQIPRFEFKMACLMNHETSFKYCLIVIKTVTNSHCFFLSFVCVHSNAQLERCMRTKIKKAKNYESQQLPLVTNPMIKWLNNSKASALSF